MTNNWRFTGEAGTDAGDYFSHQRKAASVADRRPVIRRASDLVGPGIDVNAIRVNDLNDVLATFNGYFSIAEGGEHAPTSAEAFVGWTSSDAELGGCQVFIGTETGRAYYRSFRRNPGNVETVYWSTWVIVPLTGGGGGGGGVTSVNGDPGPNVVLDAGDVGAATPAYVTAAIGAATAGFATTSYVATAIAAAMVDVATDTELAAAVSAAISGLIGTAPGVLDTLGEIADALGDDPNFAATITTALAGKQPLHANLTALSGLTGAANKINLWTGPGAMSVIDFSPLAQQLAADTTVAAFRGHILATNARPSVNTQTTDYQLQATDEDVVVQINSASAKNLTIPSDTTDPTIPTNFEVRRIVRLGTGAVNIVADTGVTINNRTDTSLSISARYGVIYAKKRAANTWIVWGDLTQTVPSAATAQVTDYTSAQTNTAYAIPTGAKVLEIEVVAGGGGGGSGRRGAAASVRSGGGSGAGGGKSTRRVLVSELAVSTLYVTVGAGGPGGAAVGADSTNGSIGTAGGTSAVRTTNGAASLANTLVSAAGGAAGFGGTATSASGGSASMNSEFPGGDGAGQSGVTGGAGVTAGAAQGAASGGGGGGGLTSGNVASDGGAGGITGGGHTGTVAGGTAAGTVNGTNATAGPILAPGNGGGGGASSVAGVGGNGGNGIRGGGGGGGGASVNGQNSGAGGTGGDGYVRITALF